MEIKIDPETGEYRREDCRLIFLGFGYHVRRQGHVWASSVVSCCARDSVLWSCLTCSCGFREDQVVGQGQERVGSSRSLGGATSRKLQVSLVRTV